ncbi:GNAT family N-acetyltransferase [Deinococcus sp.]|uniref:GNAT family N-acetyltransferase n=1 Tax=Deinococcus sp. TaxID=47478 RepID=UPI0025F8697F|nr:GNAT family N-acetyltransferase [Deinococcus sp.]
MERPAALTLRPATPADAETIQSQRDAMFTEMGDPQGRVPLAHAASVQWLRDHLESGEYSGVLAEVGGRVIGGAGVLWQSLPPSPRTLSTLRAYVLNVYVAPDGRGQGLAGLLIELLLAECRALGVDHVTLHASDAGRRTYERLGFGPTNEMRLTLGTAS